jgi:membrane associated rhomboid family serine protease
MEIIYAPGTTVLILITIFVTFYSFFNHKILYRLCLEPSEVITKKRFWQFFTYPFISGNITSLVINCAAIWFFGYALESYMVSVTHFWGHLYFGYYFGFGAVISGLLNFLVRRKDTNFILAGSESIALGCALFMLFFDPRVTFYFYFLDEGIPGLISLLFAELEQNHGKKFVSALLGLLTLAVEGISENEAEDLLSTMEDV